MVLGPNFLKGRNAEGRLNPIFCAALVPIANSLGTVAETLFGGALFVLIWRLAYCRLF
jgi:hypothetical protein